MLTTEQAIHQLIRKHHGSYLQDYFWGLKGKGDKLAVSISYKVAKSRKWTDFEFEVSPEELGWFKKGSMTFVTVESNVINPRARKLQSGLFLFVVKFRIPKVAPYTNWWLLKIDNRLWLKVINESGIDTHDLPQVIWDKFSDKAKAYEKREFLTVRKYKQLKNEGVLMPMLNEQGEVRAGY